jgi:hypothetical protein
MRRKERAKYQTYVATDVLGVFTRAKKNGCSDFLPEATKETELTRSHNRELNTQTRMRQ